MDLQINVSDLLKESVGASRTGEFDATPLEVENEAPSLVKGKVTLTRTDNGIWVAGRVDITVDHVCSRCLVPFTSSLHIEMDDVFLPVVDVLSGTKLRHEDEADIDADKLGIDDHHVLDLSGALLEYRQAAMPLAPLCRPDCKGLCPECGTDWNESTCACEPHLDPRWDKLRELLG